MDFWIMVILQDRLSTTKVNFLLTPYTKQRIHPDFASA